MYVCNYCKKEYSSKGILETHQKTAKFCLRIRNKEEEVLFLKCEYCKDIFSRKHHLDRHYESCKIRLDSIQEEKEKIKEENEHKKDLLIAKLQDELRILMTETYPERENKWKEELNNYKIENRVKDEKLKMKDEQLKMKDDIIFKLEKEVNSLKDKVDDTYNALIEHSDKTYNSFFEKEEKLVDTLIQQNIKISETNNSKSQKTINNNYTINNYGIKPLTSDTVIDAFNSYNLKNPHAFNGYQYDCNTSERGSLKLEFVFYGIVKELRDYYGITDISREKIVYNHNGEITLTTMQEFIRTNIVMNNIDSILEYIEDLQNQIEKRIEDGLIEIKGEERIMTEEEKNKLKDKRESLNYVYKIFKGSKEMGTASRYLIETFSEEAMKVGKVIKKVKQCEFTQKDTLKTIDDKSK